MIISIKTSKGSLVNHKVKSLVKIQHTGDKASLTSGSGGKNTLKWYLKSEQMDRRTHRRTDRRTFRLEGQCFEKCLLRFYIEIKHPDTNMPIPEWSCEICKEPYPHSRALKGHIKRFHKTKLFFFGILCEIMYKTKYTLARHTDSEEYLKVKTKLELKIWLQNVKSDVKANKICLLGFY